MGWLRRLMTGGFAPTSVRSQPSAPPMTREELPPLDSAGPKEAEGLFLAASWAEKQGDLDEAIRFYTRAARAGHSQSMVSLALCLKERGQTKEMIHWYETAAAKGNSNAMFNLGNHFKTAGDIRMTIHWYEAAATAGDRDAPMLAAGAHLQAGAIDEAIHWSGVAMKTGNPLAAEVLPTLRGAKSGDPTKMREVGNICHVAGHRAQAIHWLRRAVNLGNVQAMNDLAALYEESGQTASALEWYTQATRAGDEDSFSGVLRILGSAERVTWLLEEVRRGNPVARRFFREYNKDL